MQNKQKAKNTTSKHRGVCLRGSKKNPWAAYISLNGKQIHLGYFKTDTEAALAYNKKAKEIWKDFAFQNDV